MSRKRRRALATALSGQVWDLSGTLVLVLGTGRIDRDGAHVRCFVLDHEHPNKPDANSIDDWTIRWFDDRSKELARRIA